MPAGWRLELFWDGETLTAANEKILSAYEDTAYDGPSAGGADGRHPDRDHHPQLDATDGVLSSWYFSNVALRTPARNASVDHALSVFCLAEGAAGLLLVLPALLFRRRRIAGRRGLCPVHRLVSRRVQAGRTDRRGVIGSFLFFTFVNCYWYLTETAVASLGLLFFLIALTLGTLLTDLIHNGSAVFHNNLFQLARRVVRGLTADSPLERKLASRIWLAALPAIAGCAGLVLLFFAAIWNVGVSGASILLMAFLCALMIPVGGGLLLWVTLRASHTMGEMAAQVSSLAAGGSAAALKLPDYDTFAPMQRDLMSLQKRGAPGGGGPAAVRAGLDGIGAE